MTAVTNPAGATAQPRQLIVTLYGLYAREGGGWLSVAALVRLLAGLGVEEPAVRSSISRLKRRGLLAAERRAGSAGYALTPAARQILDDGDARIFGRRRATAADGWVLVVFSVPESERDKRHLLRSRLARLGFGTVAPGVWIAPGHVAGEAADALGRLGLDGYVQLFRCDHLGDRLGGRPAQVREWWDLDALCGRYAAFLDRHGPVRARWARRRRPDPERAFADYVALVTDWRELPYADPGLPLAVLPRGWNGVAAAGLFADLGDRLSGPARGHARALIAGE
ncbi:PaaX family transcriptional regulator [Pseudonocardia adelaidensis]|uniref:PaaX family transcriptional regulator C-terminal domain-containing protein n=1 Tax=Pseudonocardia adelaidensis TaxID=648754 RepID=A0ABP9NVY8_9PSEU